MLPMKELPGLALALALGEGNERGWIGIGIATYNGENHSKEGLRYAPFHWHNQGHCWELGDKALEAALSADMRVHGKHQHPFPESHATNCPTRLFSIPKLSKPSTHLAN